MQSMTWSVWAGVLGIAGALAGCGGGFSTERATARCDQLSGALGQAMTDEVYAECVACHEECGADCDARATTPVSFVCRD